MILEHQTPLGFVRCIVVSLSMSRLELMPGLIVLRLWLSATLGRR